MMSPSFRLELGLVALLSSLMFGQQREPERLSGDAWAKDIDLLVKRLSAGGTTFDFARGFSSRGQRDFKKLYPDAVFGREIATLKENLSRYSDAELVLRLMRIVALAHVSHNAVETPAGMGFNQRLPLGFFWYADGLAVTSATQAHQHVLGQRVRAIGPMRPEEALRAIAPFISYENEVWLRLLAPQFLTLRPVLEHLRLADAAGRVQFTLEDRVGTVSVVSVPHETDTGPKISLAEATSAATPVYRSEPGKLYWYRYLDDSRTAYVQYNACVNDKKNRFSRFTREVMADLDARPADCFVLDLRWNGGGDSRVIRPLTSALKARPRLSGRIYVLIGPQTFSSAVDNAIEFQRDLNAKLVGEASGGKPGGYGEVKKIRLPNSRLVVRYTSKYFGSEDALKPASLDPDIPAPLKLSDVIAGRDPAMIAVASRR